MLYTILILINLNEVLVTLSLVWLKLEDRYGDLRSEVVSILSCMDHTKINYDLIETLVIWILTGHHEYPREGSILIFLPGIGEISTLFEKLEKATVLNGLSGKCVILPLHSSLTSEEQKYYFTHMLFQTLAISFTPQKP